jgi:hypothetical protein
MTFDEFHNALRILASIDQHEIACPMSGKSPPTLLWGDRGPKRPCNRYPSL